MGHFAAATCIKDQPNEVFILSNDHKLLDDIGATSAIGSTPQLVDEIELARRLSEKVAMPDLLVVDRQCVTGGAPESGCEFLSMVCAKYPSMPVIMLPSPADTTTGGFEGRAAAIAMLRKLLDDGSSEYRTPIFMNRSKLRSPGCEKSEIEIDADTTFVRSSPKMRAIESQCELVAKTDIPVLILGESGTGKEVIAKFIHKISARSDRGFLKVNCAAMPADLLESELFGYEQGAFTGALKSKPGKFELCDGGTIFLDEIGEVPYALQAKLLHVLQDGTFARLGSRSIVKVNVRVIAATNIDIKSSIAQKTFRNDLYYRLNGFTVQMPPLRDRVEEILLLAHYFLRKASIKYKCDLPLISPRLMSGLTKYSWPGNLRELENVMRRYLVMADEQAILEELGSNESCESSVDDSVAPMASLKHIVRNLKGNAEATAIAQSLETTGWNRKAAAVDLQISYKALLYKIKQYNLISPKTGSSRADCEPSSQSNWN